MTQKIYNMIHYGPLWPKKNNMIHDPLWPTMTQKFILWSTLLWPKNFDNMTTKTQKKILRSTMTHYDPLWPKKILIWSTMTHYDPKNFYYDPLWPTMTQKFLIWSTLWPTMTQKNSNMIHYDQLWSKKLLLWFTLWQTMTQRNF